VTSLKPTIAMLAALASLPAQAQQQRSLEETQALLAPYANMEDAVTMPDGRTAHFTCMGEGSPTVILIAGMGVNAAISWATTQPEMAKTTRVCAWDRPGWGLSDGAEGKHTVATSTAALEAALATGKIPGPYIMVGHSLGGYESLLYADRHPDQVGRHGDGRSEHSRPAGPFGKRRHGGPRSCGGPERRVPQLCCGDP